METGQRIYKRSYKNGQGPRCGNCGEIGHYRTGCSVTKRVGAESPRPEVTDGDLEPRRGGPSDGVVADATSMADVLPAEVSAANDDATTDGDGQAA